MSKGPRKHIYRRSTAYTSISGVETSLKMPLKSGKESYVSVLSVVRLFEWVFLEWIRSLIKADTRNLLRICQKTRIVSEEMYNKLRDGFSPESTAKSVLQKTREASREQVMALLDLIQEYGTGIQPQQLKLVRHTLNTKVRTNTGPSVSKSTRCSTAIVRMREERQAEDFVTMKEAVTVLFKDIGQHTTTELESLRKQCSDAEKVRKENEELKAKVELLMKENAAYQTYMKQFSTTIVELNHKLKENSEEMGKKDDLLKEQQEETEKVQQENTKLKEQLQEKTVELQRALKEIETLNQKITAMEKKSDTERQEQSRCNQELESRLQRLEMKDQKTSNRLAFNPKATTLELFGNSLPHGASPPSPRLQEPLPPIPEKPKLQSRYSH